MIKSRIKRRGMKRIVFDNIIDPRTGKKAAIVVPISCSGDSGATAGREYSRDLTEMFKKGTFVAHEGDCSGTLWRPKNKEEVTARAEAGAVRLMERFGQP